jgi:hypothetical protein
MRNKILILTIILLSLSVSHGFAQSLRPLSINFLTNANFDNAEWTWTPMVTFSVRGPIESGSIITVEYTLPGGKPFVTAKCETYPAETGELRRFDLCGKDLPSVKTINQTGKFGFQIKLGKASGESKVLYAGKFDVGRQLYNPDGVAEKNKQFYYFIDYDSLLQFAYVGTYSGDLSNNLYSQFWIKNRIDDKSAVSGLLFYQGRQVAEISASFLMDALPKENPKQEYQLIGLNFQALMDKPPSDGMNDWFRVFENPGDYEIRLMRGGKPARALKFSIGKDGKPVPNGIGKELITAGIIVPAVILGDTDGVFNKAAWKDGVFGNPVSGLSLP